MIFAQSGTQNANPDELPTYSSAPGGFCPSQFPACLTARTGWHSWTVSSDSVVPTLFNMKSQNTQNGSPQSQPQRPPGSFLKPVFQVTTACNYRSVGAFKIAADSPELAKQMAESIAKQSIVIYPGEDLGVPEGVVDTIGATELKEFSVVGLAPELKKGGFDLSSLPELMQKPALKHADTKPNNRH